MEGREKEGDQVREEGEAGHLRQFGHNFERLGEFCVLSGEKATHR